ncbi:MAG: hypothetical protein KBA46_00280 [Candidatus Omnitrophica bacterium]|nr:hypothetical protein [Candidatus Omnitrophota bacterium]
MKLSRFLFSLVFITMLSLLYVYEQTEIVRLAYTGQKQSQLFEELLDRNKVLRYNIAKNASLVHLGGKMNEADFQMPERYRLLKVAGAQTRLSSASRVAQKGNLLSRFFSIKRLAQAQTINP